MGLQRIGQLNVKDMAGPCRTILVLEREQDLDTAVKVSGHPVRGSHIDLFISAVSEAEDAGVLQEGSYDGPHRDILGDSRYPGLQAADAADDQIDLYAGAGCLVELGYDIAVAERIHLRDDVSRFMCLRMADLTVDQ